MYKSKFINIWNKSFLFKKLAPGSPGNNNNEDDEEDELDAFMAGIEVIITKNFKT